MTGQISEATFHLEGLPVFIDIGKVLKPLDNQSYGYQTRQFYNSQNKYLSLFYSQIIDSLQDYSILPR
jgi:hypothetical protein